MVLLWTPMVTYGLHGPPMNPYGPPMDPYGPPMDPYGPPMDPYGPPMDPYGLLMTYCPPIYYHDSPIAYFLGFL